MQEKKQSKSEEFNLANYFKTAFILGTLLNISIPIILYKLTGIFNPIGNWATAALNIGIYYWVVRKW